MNTIRLYLAATLVLLCTAVAAAHAGGDHFSGDFDATGQIPCAQYPGQPMTECEFGVARAGGGYATVVIKKPDDRTRAIFFRMW